MAKHASLAAPSSVGDPMNYAAVTAAILANPTGATIDNRGIDYRGSGIAVALPEHGRIIALSVASAMVGEWVATVAPHVTTHAARYFGCWVDDEVLYLDVVEIFSDEDEDRAISAGYARGELAVYHHGRQETIALDDGARKELDQR